MVYDCTVAPPTATVSTLQNTNRKSYLASQMCKSACCLSARKCPTSCFFGLGPRQLNSLTVMFVYFAMSPVSLCRVVLFDVDVVVCMLVVVVLGVDCAGRHC